MKSKRILKNLHNSISIKMVLIFLAFLVPVYALLVISAYAYMGSLEDQACSAVKSILEMNLAGVTSEQRKIDQFFYDLQENDADYARLLEWKGNDADKLAYVKFNRKLVSRNSLSQYSEAFFLHMQKEDDTLFVAQYLNHERKQEILNALKQTGYLHENIRWENWNLGGTDYLGHTIGYGGVYLGAMIDVTALMQTIQGLLPYEKTQIRLEGQLPESGLATGVQLDGTKKYICVWLDRGEVRSAMPLVSRIISAVGLLLLILLPIALVLAFFRLIVRPIRRIEKGLAILGKEDLDYRIPDMKASREFIGLKDSVNTMAGEIQTLRIRGYEEQLERERMLLQNLLLQIRPHFLLNFFNQIFSMAELEDYDGIKKSSLYLSKFFRYLFRSERIATFKSELTLVDDYLELMDERFLDCFYVERDIDESLLGYRIPPLIVQNFVENIFKYAVSEGSYIRIGLSLRREGDYVVMTVEDDGPGMEEDTLNKIRDAKPVEKADGTHIGIYNSAYRLKKLCGEDCVLDVQSVLTEGTTVKIKLPYKAETGKEQAQ